jgi:voltage-gated potassium channel
MKQNGVSKGPKDNENFQRYRWLRAFSERSEILLVGLGFAWLVLLVVELIWHLTPFLESVVLIIWVIFILDFLIRLFLASRKWTFLKQNVLTIVSLFIPAFRVFRVFASLRLLRTIGVIRSLRVIRVVTSINRGMRALGRAFDRRAFGYVILLTLMVCFVGAAAMFAFEKETGAFTNYWDALWWTAMLLTSIASEYWPRTAEGKAVTLFLGIYSLGVLGYFTAMLASFFIGQDANNQKGEIAGAKQIDQIARELKRLREEVAKINKAPEKTE